MSLAVAPLNGSDHDLHSADCPCGPRVEYLDDETGLPYPLGPLIVHEDPKHTGLWGVFEDSL